jgi:polyhydroxyalkanoate synthesis regulator phasin
VDMSLNCPPAPASDLSQRGGLGYPRRMETTESKDKRPLAEYFEKAWSQALVAVSTVEEEATKVTHRIAELAGWSQDEARRYVREFSERLASQRRDLEKNVEDAVRRTVSRVRIPRREQVADLQGRLERLGQRIDALQEKR